MVGSSQVLYAMQRGSKTVSKTARLKGLSREKGGIHVGDRGRLIIRSWSANIRKCVEQRLPGGNDHTLNMRNAQLSHRAFNQCDGLMDFDEHTRQSKGI